MTTGFVIMREVQYKTRYYTGYENPAGSQWSPHIEDALVYNEEADAIYRRFVIVCQKQGLFVVAVRTVDEAIVIELMDS